MRNPSKPLAEMGQYSTVVIDPPWPLRSTGYSDASRRHHDGGAFGDVPYDTLTLADIEALPIAAVLRDDAFVFCWTINRYLRDAFDIVSAWGCAYSYTMVWHKSNGTQMPHTPRFNAEFCIVGRRGSPSWVSTKAFRLVNFWPWAGHSVKPEGFYDLLRRVTPTPRLDVFGRRRIAGFASWGFEAPAAEPLPDHYQEVLLDT